MPPEILAIFMTKAIFAGMLLSLRVPLDSDRYSKWVKSCYGLAMALPTALLFGLSCYWVAFSGDWQALIPVYGGFGMAFGFGRTVIRKRLFKPNDLAQPGART